MQITLLELDNYHCTLCYCRQFTMLYMMGILYLVQITLL